MADLYESNLLLWKELSGESSPADPLLGSLSEAACSGAGHVLRITPHRTVLRIPHEGSDWVLKLCHPVRSAEGLRRLFSRPPALREAAAANALAERLAGAPLGRVRAEQLTPSFGLFARPWVPGGNAASLLPGEAESLGAALGALHALGWSDPDLLPQDLVLAPDGWIPVDFGQARVSSDAAPPLSQRRDLVRLLSALPPDVSARCAEALVGAHERISPGGRSSEELLVEARTERERALWRHSARCLRTNRDFERSRNGASRRDDPNAKDHGNHGHNADKANAAAELEQIVLGESRRGRTLRHGNTVTKEYRRSGWRSFLGTGPARRGYRFLYLLELHGIACARAHGWFQKPGIGTMYARSLPGQEAELHDLPALAGWLAGLHRAGLGLRDAKLSNFRRDELGMLCLADPDGLRRKNPRPARDLGRLLAEAPEHSDTESDAANWYADETGADDRLLADARRHARRFRGILSNA